VTSIAAKPMDQRMVKVSNLGRSSGAGKALAIVGLLGLVAAAAWFVLMRLV
jgi:hypothetical protein